MTPSDWFNPAQTVYVTPGYIHLRAKKAAMTRVYRFYKLDQRGHINGLPEPVECFDDGDAIEKAKERAKNCVIEIWDLKRRVAVIEAQDKSGDAGTKVGPGSFAVSTELTAPPIPSGTV